MGIVRHGSRRSSFDVAREFFIYLPSFFFQNLEDRPLPNPRPQQQVPCRGYIGASYGCRSPPWVGGKREGLKKGGRRHAILAGRNRKHARAGEGIPSGSPPRALRAICRITYGFPGLQRTFFSSFARPFPWEFSAATRDVFFLSLQGTRRGGGGGVVGPSWRPNP